MGCRFTRRLIGFVGAALWLAPPAVACDLPVAETATVASVEDGETLELTDGRKVRLLGIKAPSAPLGWKGEDPWPFVAEATAALARLATGATVELGFDERRQDRYGHLLAQVTVLRGEERLWLQDDLVARGFARVYSLPDTRACVAELLAREDEARRTRRGLWRSWAYRVEDAGDVKRLGRLTHSYQLVEGQVHAVGEGRKLLYVNFARRLAEGLHHHHRAERPGRVRGRRSRPRAACRQARAGAGRGRMVERTDDRRHDPRADRGPGPGARALSGLPHKRKGPGVAARP